MKIERGKSEHSMKQWGFPSLFSLAFYKFFESEQLRFRTEQLSACVGI